MNISIPDYRSVGLSRTAISAGWLIVICPSGPRGRRREGELLGVEVRLRGPVIKPFYRRTDLLAKRCNAYSWVFSLRLTWARISTSNVEDDGDRGHD